MGPAQTSDRKAREPSLVTRPRLCLAVRKGETGGRSRQVPEVTLWARRGGARGAECGARGAGCGGGVQVASSSAPKLTLLLSPDLRLLSSLAMRTLLRADLDKRIEMLPGAAQWAPDGDGAWRVGVRRVGHLGRNLPRSPGGPACPLAGA